MYVQNFSHPLEEVLGVSSRDCRQKRDISKFWHKLKKKIRLEMTSPVNPKLQKFSLFIPVKLSWKTGMRFARALVDTGASFPIIVNSGVLPVEALQQSRFPVRFTNASGLKMSGGNLGAPVRISLPVYEDTPGESIPVEACCSTLWAMTVDIADVDVILGYPFFKLFGLGVDATRDCVRFSAQQKPVGNGPPTALDITVPGSSRDECLEAAVMGNENPGDPAILAPVSQEVCTASWGCTMFECECLNCKVPVNVLPLETLPLVDEHLGMSTTGDILLTTPKSPVLSTPVRNLPASCIDRVCGVAPAPREVPENTVLGMTPHPLPVKTELDLKVFPLGKSLQFQTSGGDD